MILHELEIIHKTVNQITGITIESKRKTIPYVRSRLIYYQIAKKLTTYSYDAIGGKLEKDHASVMHNLKNFERDILKDEHYRLQFNKAYKICSDILFNNKDVNLKEINKVDELMIENINLKTKLAMMSAELEKLLTVKDETENKLLSVFRQMKFTDKMDLIFKANTIFKVRQKLEA